MSPTWEEEQKRAVHCKIGNESAVILDPQLRAVAEKTFKEYKGAAHTMLALYLSATITEKYIIQNYPMEEPITMEMIDNRALSIVPSLAFPSSKKAYRTEDVDKPSQFCRSNRDAFPVPPKLADVAKTLIGFQGTSNEFEACVGWLQTKCASLKSLKFLFVRGKESPFTYNEYNTDFNNMV